MRIDSKAFSGSSARRSGGRGAFAGAAALIIGLGLAVVCLTPNSPAAPVERAAKDQVASAPVRVAAIPRAPVQLAATPAPQVTAQVTAAVPVTRQAQKRCSDPGDAFLDPSCRIAMKRHLSSRHHRSVTFVAGNATAAPPSAVVAKVAPTAQATPTTRQQTATRSRPPLVTARPVPAERPLSLAPPLKTAQRTPTVTAE